MVGRGKIIPILIGAVSLCAVVRADMVSLSPAVTGCVPSQQTRLTVDSPSASSSTPCLGFAEIVDFSWLLVDSLAEPKAETGQADEAKSPQILMDRQSSVSLCLYALLGLGLCRSAPWVKRLHFGCLPDWYHSSGPYQIGHGYAIAPDCRRSALLPCFVPPGHQPDDISPRCFPGTIASFLKRPRVVCWELGSRGPPDTS
jgi:hypothetical protein